MKTLTVSQNNLGDFDDQIASLKVEGDCNVTLFNDPDFKGKMMTFIPGVYETALQLRDVFKKASSIEINVWAMVNISGFHIESKWNCQFHTSVSVLEIKDTLTNTANVQSSITD